MNGPAPQARTRPQVLVVDDDPEVCKMVERIVESMGHACISAGRAKDAMVHILKGDADLLLLDLKMPGITGMDLLRSLRRRHMRLPTIVISAFISPDVAKQLAELGVRNMLVKPFERARLVLEIQQLLQATAGQAPMS